ncbi:hypothetical protein [Plesiomonas shigelloides]|uniref:hypothetical protein n=1 Tax=Plesiomonas shigelloides TaxID=703 RepID=UPI002FCB2EFB
MNTKERNELVKEYITSKLDRAELLEENYFTTIKNYSELSSILVNLIESKSMGFRGVVATALAGLHLDGSFNPLTSFYSCNPRAIFEKGIFYAFENRVPCGKSDPLNVAKNTNVLDLEWARGKRPQTASVAVVHYLEKVMSASGHERGMLIDFFFFRLMAYSKRVKNFVIANPISDVISHQDIANKLADFVCRYPESGTTPQYVISVLLRECFKHSAVSVLGGDESVFGTNTTSKKPADVWLELNNEPFMLYEVTVKCVDLKRLDDSIQSLNSVGVLNLPIHFICRLPDDVSQLNNYHNGVLNYKGKAFNFVNLEDFILSIVSMLSVDSIKMVLNDLSIFMNKIDRKVSTKRGWNAVFAGEPFLGN